MDELTPDEVKQTIEEIETWYRHTTQLDTLRVRYLVYFYDLPVETYEIMLEDGAIEFFYRNDAGEIAPVGRHAYAVLGNTMKENREDASGHGSISMG